MTSAKLMELKLAITGKGPRKFNDRSQNLLALTKIHPGKFAPCCRGASTPCSPFSLSQAKCAARASRLRFPDSSVGIHRAA